MTTSRSDIEFKSGPAGALCRGWYYPGRSDDAPVIVMAHGLGGVKEMRIDAYAERFAARGYACIAFDYRHFGASDGQPRQIIEVPLQLADWRAAVAHARKIRPSSPVVLWGTSFAGGHVLTIGAEDKNVAAVVSQCPHTSGPAAVRQIDFVTAARIGVLGIRDLVAKILGQPPVTVALAAPVGEVGLMNGPGAEAIGRKLLVTAGAAQPPERVAARIGLFIGAYSPGKYAKDLRCPTLFCLCTEDNVAPAAVAKRYALRAPHGEIREYEAGHFDIYMDEPFERVISDQIAFLERHVPVGT